MQSEYVKSGKITHSFCLVSYKKQETKTAQNSGTLIDFSTWVYQKTKIKLN